MFNLMNAHELFLLQTVLDSLAIIRKMARTIAKTFVGEREAIRIPIIEEK